MRVRAAVLALSLVIVESRAFSQGDFISKEIAVYPFNAPPARATIIRARYKDIRPGMRVSDVKTILGEPDEIRPLYEPKVKNARLVGHTYCYVIRRLVKNGSANERQESLVRVSFSLDGSVTKVVEWGLGGGA